MTARSRPVCPCCVRRAERALAAARRRSCAALAAAALSALAVLCLSADRVVVSAVAAVTATALAGWALAAWAHRQRRQAVADWRTRPPGTDPWSGG